MGMLTTILERIKKPLLFAARDDFAHLKSLSDIEPFMQAQVEELRRSGGASEIADGLGGLFSGIDRLSLVGKKERIKRAMDLLALFEQGTAPIPPPAPPATDLRRSSMPAVLSPDTPIQFCKGIGPKRAALLGKIGIATVEDALWYLPWRYEDRGNLKKIGRVTFGSFETVMGQVVSAEVVQTKRRRVKVFELTITDRSGFLVGSWFNQPFMQKTFRPGQTVLLSGVVKSNPYKGGAPQMDNPEHEIIDGDDEESARIHTGRIVPIYRATAGLTVRAIRTMMKQIVDGCAASIPECLPPRVVRHHSFPPAAEAVREAHFPERETDIAALNRGASAAHQRLSFEELFLLELGLALRKRGVAVEKKGIAFHDPIKLESQLRASLPFRLTAAQERVVAEIKKDMAAERPMNRLVQGDVGCGKTVVALIAALMAVESGYQACLMAPTEILAEQHARNLAVYAAPLGVSVRLLTGSVRKKERASLLEEISAGSARIVVGTHALIEEEVRFQRLGIAIIDEQHRFGVMQRSTLTSKGYAPDVLIMTATPIPRTLALTVYGDLDVSVIDELPPGRTAVDTRLVFESRRKDAYQLIEAELGKGRQAYVVYPLVAETEKSDLKAATEMAEHLQKDVFPERRIGLLHGRMKGAEKEAVMADFTSGRTQVLVSTTVIEVGVDVPNATVMMIEHPERFGLSQLHQLRGRVGRGGGRSFCILMGPRMFAEDARERLNAFARTSDGFRIAEEDLRLRGPGEFFGTRQSGLPDLRAANLIRDAKLLEDARTEAFGLLASDPGLEGHPHLRASLKKRWEGKLGLISVS